MIVIRDLVNAVVASCYFVGHYCYSFHLCLPVRAAKLPSVDFWDGMFVCLSRGEGSMAMGS
jgi:hypothetical protein